MSRNITNREYRRRVFNAALLEAIKKPYLEALGVTNTLQAPMTEAADDTSAASKAKDALRRLSETANKTSDQSEEASPTKTDGTPKQSSKDKTALNGCGDGGFGADTSMCESVCNSYFTEELQLESSSVDATIRRLQDANFYITEACDECKEIADKHYQDAEAAKEEHKDDEEIQLTPEDNEVLDQLFHSKGPGPQIDEIRDATVKALLSEEKKSKEVRDALDLANSKVSTGDVNAYNETASRIAKIGPTSLMGAIMNHVSRSAINSVNEAGNFTSVGQVMEENADLIKTRSAMLYAVMETGNQLEITHMSSKDVERLANNIFYQK